MNLTPTFSTGAIGRPTLDPEQERIARLLEALVTQTPGGLVQSTGETLGMVGDVLGSIGQPQRAEALGQQVRRTLPDIVSAVRQRPAEVATAFGQGMEQEVLDKGAGAVFGLEDLILPGGKALGMLGASAMAMGKLPPASKAAQDIVDLSKARQTPRQMRLQELADEQIARGEVPGASKANELQQRIDNLNPILQSQIKDAFNPPKGMDPWEAVKKPERTARELEDLNNKLDQFTNLDDVEKARLDRAVQQGFNIDAFHGTKGDIESFDPGLLGVTTSAPSARRGFFFSADPETAHNYIEMSSLEDVRPSLINEIENTVEDLGKEVLALDEEVNKQKYNINSKTHGNNWRSARKDFVNEYVQKTKLKEKDQKLQNYKRILREEQDFESKTGGNILPVKLRLQNPLEYDFGGKAYRDVTYNDLLKQAQEAGNDGAIFRNTTDGGGVTDIYVVFEPSQIRSRYAAFDPNENASGSLIANAPPILFPLGVGTAAAAYSANQEQ